MTASRTKQPRRLTALCLAALLVIGGCAVGPDYQEPAIEMPDAWHQELVRGLSAGDAGLDTWWTVLGDPVLVGLIDRAGQGSLELRQAFERIAEAMARRGIAVGEWFPSVDSATLYERSQLSEEVLGPLGGTPRDLYSTGLGTTWEVDLFGRIRRSVESASASFEASIEDYRDVLVVLLADVGFNYVDAIASQYRVELAKENAEMQRESLQLTEDRFDAGLTSALDVAQAESNLANTEAGIPRLESRLNAALNRVAVLLGENPGSFHDLLHGSTRIPRPPVEIVVGIPADVVRQRPDIRRAERELAANTALIGAAMADLYPRFSLTGFFGLDSGDIGDLLEGDSVAWSVGLPFVGNLFDGGGRRGRVEVERARTDQLLSYYKLTVLIALEEVENALVNLAKERTRRDRLVRAVKASERSVGLVQTQYRTGLTDFQNVLDSERSLTDQQDKLAESQGLVISNLIELYRALGGGWQPDPENLETFTTAVFE